MEPEIITEEIKKSNALIHVFMGNNLSDEYIYRSKGVKYKLIYNLKYHKDWNSIMQVIEKIESLNYQVTINSLSCLIEKYYGNSQKLKILRYGKTRFESTYNIIITFIEHYNETKQQLATKTANV